MRRKSVRVEAILIFCRLKNIVKDAGDKIKEFQEELEALEAEEGEPEEGEGDDEVPTLISMEEANKVATEKEQAAVATPTTDAKVSFFLFFEFF